MLVKFYYNNNIPTRGSGRVITSVAALGASVDVTMPDVIPPRDGDVVTISTDVAGHVNDVPRVLCYTDGAGRAWYYDVGAWSIVNDKAVNATVYVNAWLTVQPSVSGTLTRGHLCSLTDHATPIVAPIGCTPTESITVFPLINLEQQTDSKNKSFYVFAHVQIKNKENIIIQGVANISTHDYSGGLGYGKIVASKIANEMGSLEQYRAVPDPETGVITWVSTGHHEDITQIYGVWLIPYILIGAQTEEIGEFWKPVGGGNGDYREILPEYDHSKFQWHANNLVYEKTIQVASNGSLKGYRILLGGSSNNIELPTVLNNNPTWTVKICTVASGSGGLSMKMRCVDGEIDCHEFFAIPYINDQANSYNTQYKQQRALQWMTIGISGAASIAAGMVNPMALVGTGAGLVGQVAGMVGQETAIANAQNKIGGTQDGISIGTIINPFGINIYYIMPQNYDKVMWALENIGADSNYPFYNYRFTNGFFRFADGDLEITPAGVTAPDLIDAIRADLTAGVYVRNPS